MGVGDRNENSTNGPAVLPLDGSSAQQDNDSDMSNLLLKNLNMPNASLRAENGQHQEQSTGYSGQQPPQRPDSANSSGYPGATQMPQGSGGFPNSVQPQRPGIPQSSGYSGQGPTGAQMSQNSVQPQRPGIPQSSGYSGQGPTGSQMSQNSVQAQRPGVPPGSEYPNQMSSGPTAPSGPQNSTQGAQRPGNPQTMEGEISNSSNGPAVLPLDGSSSQQDSDSDMNNMLKNLSVQNASLRAENGQHQEQSTGYSVQQPPQRPDSANSSGYPGATQMPLGSGGYQNQNSVQPPRPGMPPTSGYSSQGPTGPQMSQNSAQPQRSGMPPSSEFTNQMASGPTAPSGPQTSIQSPQRPGMAPTSGYSGQMPSGPGLPPMQNSVQRPGMQPSSGYPGQTTSGPGLPSALQNSVQPPQRPGMPQASGYSGQMPTGPPMPQNSIQPQRPGMTQSSEYPNQMGSGPGAPPGPQNSTQAPQRPGMPPMSGYSGQMPSGPGLPPMQNSVQPTGMPPSSGSGYPGQMASGSGLPPVGQNSTQAPQRPGMPPTSGYSSQGPTGPSMPQNSVQPQRPGIPPSSGYPNQMASGPGAPPGPQNSAQPPQSHGMPPTSGFPGQISSGPGAPPGPQNSSQPPQSHGMPPTSGFPGQISSGPGVPPGTQNSTQPPQSHGMPPTSGYPGQISSGPGAPPGPQNSTQPPQSHGMPPTSGYPGQQASGPGLPPMQNSIQRPGMQPMSGFPGQMPSGPGGLPPASQNAIQPPQRPGMQPSSGYPGQSLSGPGLPPSQGFPGQNQDASQSQQGFSNQMPPGPGGQPSYGYPGQPQGQQGMPPTQRYPAQPSQRPGMPPNVGYPGQSPAGPGLPPSQPGFPAPGGMPNSQPPAPGLYPSGAGQNQGMPPGPQGYANNQMQPPAPGMTPSFGYGQPQGQGMPPAPGQQPFTGQQGPGMMGPTVGGPNTQAQWSNQGGPAYPQPSAQQQQKRLDPDQMPSAIGVMQEDQQTRSGLFQTNAKGLLPPLVTTKFQVDDQGNASPRFIRSTMYSVPAQPDMLKQTAIPFALVINPFESPAKDEQPLQWVDLGPMGPVRCIRCKAYMSPLMQFIDGGRRFQCLLCKATTEVPAEYFQHMDHTGSRIDKWERPELCKGSYEIVATTEYCRGNMMPKEPAFIFVIDVSYNNVKSGLVNLLCSHMKTLLESLPSHTPVGFITYNSKVHFFNIDPSLTQPQMVIVPDVADMFMPLLTGFLVPRAEAVASIDILMEQIPTLFADTKETESVLGPAIQAGMEALKASDRVGKLLLFHSSLPTSDVAPGKLRNREAERKLLGTDKEKAVLTPQSTYYNNLGQDCVQNGVSVDLYLFNNSYIDVATIGQVARISGGAVNKYTYFQADIDGPRVVGELTYHLSRPIGFDAVMRVRTSTGVRPTDFHGHFFMANTTDVEIAAIDSNKGIAVEIKHDDKLTDEDGVYIQVALLYTSIYGQRRLRIHNLALNTCNQMADLYRNCELDTITNFLAKQCISKSVDSTPQAIKEGVINRCAQMLATYRKHCANPSMPGQLILPECLKLLPLYINCVLRSDAVSGNHEITPDDRSWLMYTTMTMGVGTSVHYFYPKLVPIAGPDVSANNEPIRCSYDKLKDDSAFILENGIYIFLWIGATVSPDWLQNIFGVSNIAQLNVETITELPDHVNSDESLRLRAFIRQLRGERNRHMRLTIVRQKDKMEMVMKRFLIEDRSSDGQPSYVDFLCHMHKEIRALLNQ